MVIASLIVDELFSALAALPAGPAADACGHRQLAESADRALFASITGTRRSYRRVGEDRLGRRLHGTDDLAGPRPGGLAAGE